MAKARAKSACCCGMSVILLAILSSCSNDSLPPVPATGTISILSVTPDTVLTDATEESFSIELEYTLNDSSQGEINIGFNNGDSINSYYMETSYLITEGTGTNTWTVTATTKDWFAEGDFKVYVNIVEYPHGDSYSPLNSDTHILSF